MITYINSFQNKNILLLLIFLLPTPLEFAGKKVTILK